MLSDQENVAASTIYNIKHNNGEVIVSQLQVPSLWWDGEQVGCHQNSDEHIEKSVMAHWCQELPRLAQGSQAILGSPRVAL